MTEILKGKNKTS